MLNNDCNTDTADCVMTDGVLFIHYYLMEVFLSKFICIYIHTHFYIGLSFKNCLYCISKNQGI